MGKQFSYGAKRNNLALHECAKFSFLTNCNNIKTYKTIKNTGDKNNEKITL